MAARIDPMEIAEAKRRIRERADLNAFISVSDESGSGPVVAVKDLIDVAGTVTTAGGIILPPTPAAADASVVKRIRDHGCVVVGKTNLHEFAYGVTSVNPHYGTVRNPHDPSRVAGGSSGGSAVAVAAGMCDWALGSDTGGSIRIPASLCGIVGFKPERGSIDITGVIPLAHSLDTLGPMANDVAAAAEAFSWMSGESLPEPRTVPRLAIPARWVNDLDEPTARAWSMVGADLPAIDFIDRERLFQTGLTVLLFEAAEYHRHWATEMPDKYGADVLRLIKRGFDIHRDEYDRARGAMLELRAEADHAMLDVDALVLPATAIVAPTIEAAYEVREPLSRFTRPFNTTGQPVVTIPAPVRGLPVGIQVVGRTNPGALAAAAWLEQRWRALVA